MLVKVHWWGVQTLKTWNFSQSNSKSSFAECNRRIDIGKQSVHACEGPLVGSANCQNLKLLSIKLRIKFPRIQSENKYWQTNNSPCLWRSTGMDCKLSRLKFLSIKLQMKFLTITSKNRYWQAYIIQSISVNVHCCNPNYSQRIKKHVFNQNVMISSYACISVAVFI